jgi:hypothetical protein
MSDLFPKETQLFIALMVIFWSTVLVGIGAFIGWIFWG